MNPKDVKRGMELKVRRGCCRAGQVGIVVDVWDDAVVLVFPGSLEGAYEWDEVEAA